MRIIMIRVCIIEVDLTFRFNSGDSDSHPRPLAGLATVTVYVSADGEGSFQAVVKYRQCTEYALQGEVVKMLFKSESYLASIRSS